MKATAPAIVPARQTDFAFDRPLVQALVACVGIAMFFMLQQPLRGFVEHLSFADPDDAMRLAQIRDLIAGQGWYDHLQHRYLPPGAFMPWSRLVDLPVALLIRLAQALFAGPAAERWVVALWPPVLFLAYLGVIYTGARRLVGPRAAPFAILCGALLPFTATFVYGRIDHHNVQALAMTGVAILLADPDAGWKKGMAAGLIGGFSLAVGLETLPFVAALGCATTLLWIVSGEARSAEAGLLRGFGVGLSAGAFAFGFVDTPPSRWWQPSCDFLSPPWYLLAGGGGLGVAGLTLVLHGRSRLSRFLLSVVLGGVLVAAFAWFFPTCLDGPWVGLPEAARTGWLDNNVEVVSLPRLFRALPMGAILIGVPLVVTCLACVAAFWWGSERERRAFLVIGVFSWAGLALTLLHVRGQYIGLTLVPIVSAWLFDRMLLNRAGRAALVAALLGAALTLTPVDFFAATPLIGSASGEGTLLGEFDLTAQCRSDEVLRKLDALPPSTLLADIDTGPPILIHTHHRIIVAPYHRNGDGIVAGLAVRSGSADDVKAAVRRFRPDYLVVCRGYAEKMSPAGSFSRDFVGGSEFPWLERVPFDETLAVARVKPDALGVQ